MVKKSTKEKRMALQFQITSLLQYNYLNHNKIDFFFCIVVIHF